MFVALYNKKREKKKEKKKRKKRKKKRKEKKKKEEKRFINSNLNFQALFDSLLSSTLPLAQKVVAFYTGATPELESVYYNRIGTYMYILCTKQLLSNTDKPT